MLLMGLGVLLAGTIVVASGSADPYFSRSARGGATTTVTSDAVYSCPEKNIVYKRENADPVVYQFVKVESDRCLWDFGGTNDENTVLERNGADIQCVVIAEPMAMAGEPATPPDGVLMGHLARKGYKPVLIKSEIVMIGGRQWRHEVADSIYVPSTRTTVQVSARNHAWSWLGPPGAGSLFCFGVTADVVANDAELQRLANSLRIVETSQKSQKGR